MDRREILRRTLEAEIYWGLGNVGCHGAYADGRPPRPASAEPAPESGEDHYVVTLDTETGEMTVAPGNAE